MATINMNSVRFLNVRYDGESKADIQIEDRDGSNLILPLNDWTINSLLKQLNALADILENNRQKTMDNIHNELTELSSK